MELKALVLFAFAGLTILLRYHSIMGAFISLESLSPCPTVSSTPETTTEPPNCEYGVHQDRCNRTVCSKGPGERCKILKFQVHGDCGDGMFCLCGYCSGCSTHTYVCHEQICVRSHHDSRK